MNADMCRTVRFACMLTAWLVLLAGCASFAKKTSTPADDISPETAAAIPAPPGERYFIVVFGSQSKPKQAKYTHTWATALRVNNYDGPGEPIVEANTISWMPDSLDIKQFSRRVEKGINLDLHVTIREMLKHNEHIAMWGPYEVKPGLNYRFMVQKQFLESGQVGYQCIDSIGEAACKGNGCDCYHAVTDMDPEFGRTRYPLSYYGESASRHIVNELHERNILIDPNACHDRILPTLGLDQYPIDRKSYSKSGLLANRR